MAAKAKSGKSKTKAKKAAKKPAKGKSVKKSARKPAKKVAKKVAKKPKQKVTKKATKKPAKKAVAKKSIAKKPASGKKQKHENVKAVAKNTSTAPDATGKKQSMINSNSKQPKKEKVGAGIVPSATAPAKARSTGVAEEPQDVDEYETQRLAAVEPFRRLGAAPKPGAAGRLFVDEEELEDYDPLFDEVEEEDE